MLCSIRILQHTLELYINNKSFYLNPGICPGFRLFDLHNMAENSIKRRIGYLDIAKGIGIILVIIGHCDALPYWAVRIIFSVHMPLFFILSGFTFSKKNSENLKVFFIKNVKMLLVPYLIAAGLIIAFFTVRAILFYGDVWNTFLTWLAAGIYGSGGLRPAFVDTLGIPFTSIGALWFLLALFFARMIFAFILKSKAVLLWVMAVFFAGFLSTEKLGWMPFDIQAGMCAVLFLYIGYIIKEKDLFNWKNIHWSLKIIMLLIWLYCCKYCGQLWMVSNTFNDGFLDVIGAVCGTFVIIYISQGLEKVSVISKAFSFIGKNSLGILCGHIIALDCYPRIIVTGLLMGKMGLSYNWAEPMMTIAASIAVSLVLYYIPWINRKVFPNRSFRRQEMKG